MVGTNLSEYSKGTLKLKRKRNAKTIEKALIIRSILKIIQEGVSLSGNFNLTLNVLLKKVNTVGS